MLAVKGYYDGNTIKTFDKISAKKNQKLIVTILDEFIEEPKMKEKTVRGVLSEYANPDLWDKEATAWEEEVSKKYGNT